MRRNTVPAALASLITAALALSACTTVHGTKQAAAPKSTANNQPAPHRTINPQAYTVKPVQHVSSFDVQADKGGSYRVTLKHGDLIEPKSNLSAATTPSNVKFGNNLGTPLGSACKGITKTNNRVMPFSISVAGLKSAISPVHIKFMAYRPTGTAAPKGSVRMEFTQSTNTARCYSLHTGISPETLGLTFGTAAPKTSTTLTGWFILGGDTSLVGYKLAVASISPVAGGKATNLKGEFTPFKIKNSKLTGGQMPILPVEHDHK